MQSRSRWLWNTLVSLLLVCGLVASASAESAFRVAQFEEDASLGWIAMEIATTADSDADGALDSEEGTGDRDGDGIPNDEDYDPTGYFYDQADGRILSGGGITVSPSGGVTTVANGSTGFYQFFVATPGVYTINMTAPPGYMLASSTCPRDDPPPLSVTNIGQPMVLGASEVGNSGFLDSNACTDYYFTINIEAGDDDVFSNNFPFVRTDFTAAPAASTYTLATMVASLILLGVWHLSRRRRRYV